MAIQSRRGLIADLDQSKLLPGEPAAPSDVEELYWAKTPGNVKKYLSESQVQDLLDDKVDKVIGKGLSTEDYTSEEKQKLADAVPKTRKVNSKELSGDITLGGADIAIQDPGGHYATKNVEAALQQNASELEENSTQIETEQKRSSRIEDSIRNLADMTEQVAPDVSVSSFAPINVLSSKARESQMNVVLKGNTILNSIINGNFSNTNGWVGDNATVTASANTLIITGGAASASVSATQTTTVKSIVNKKVYFKCRVKVTNSACTSIQLLTYNGTTTKVVATKATPTSDTWYDVSGVATQTDIGASGLLTMYIRHMYADSATANGKVMNVKEAQLIDMGVDASNPLYNNTVADMDILTEHYIDGLRSTACGRVRTTGKNLYPSGVTESGTITTALGIDTVNVAHARTKGFISVAPGNNIVIKLPTGYKIRYFYFFAPDKTFLYASAFLDINQATAIVPANTKYIRIVFTNTGVTTLTQADIDAIQSGVLLETGTVSTTYEPYTETLAYLPTNIGKSLQNSVRDEINLGSGERIQRIKEYALQASDFTGFSTSATNFDYVMILKPLDWKMYLDNVYQISGSATLEGSLGDKTYADMAANVGYIFNYSTTTLLYAIAKGLYANLAAAQAALTGKKFTYQLTNPIITNYLPTPLKSSPSGSLIYEHVKGEVGFYTTSLAVTDTTLPIKAITRLVKVNELDGSSTPLTISTAVIASDKLSFTHPNLVSGDLVDWDYEYDSALSTNPKIEYGYSNGYSASTVLMPDGTSLETDLGMPATNLVSSDFSVGTAGWGHYSSRSTESAVNGWLRSTFNSIGIVFGSVSAFGIAATHKIYVKTKIRGNKASTASIDCYKTGLGADSVSDVSTVSVSTTAADVSRVLTNTDTANGITISATNYNTAGDYVEIQYALVLDLTAIFGAGSEPTKSEMDILLAKYTELHFSGTVNPLLTHKEMFSFFKKNKANVVQEDAIMPTFVNGWARATSIASAVGFYKDTEGIVHMDGAINGGVAGTVAFTLPVGYRPRSYAQFICACTGSVVGRLEVASTGVVTIIAFSSYISLDGISFRAYS